jgi:DNA-binding transcriptional ArsR family regulator
MKVKIVLVDGVVVEADGTAQEIADLTDALRRSHQVPRPEDEKTSAPTDTIQPGEAEPDDRSKFIGFGNEGVPEPLDEDGDRDQGGTGLDVEEGVEPEEAEDLPGAADAPTHGADGAPGPPLDLVVREVAGQFRLLGDPTRLRILALLTDGLHNVGELCESLGGQSQPAVSHHLALLRLSGLVTPIREGKFNNYDLTDQGRTLTEAVSRFGTPGGAGASAMFRQASDPTRLQILATLSGRDRNVGELCSDLGGMSQPAVSHHLALLRHGGLIEARRAGKFSYYSLREGGRELTRLVVPMMAAKARGVSDPAGDTFQTEKIDFSAIPDDWMCDTPPTDGDVEVGDPTAPGGGPPSHMLCRSVLMMVRELHRLGYERLRVAPGLSPSGLYWRCSVVPVSRVRRDHGAMAVDGLAARYESGQGARFFDWEDAERDAPVALADKFLERFPDVAVQGKGGDPEYARWYARMLRATDPDGLIYAYADWELPGDHLPALGCTADVKIPLPPPGEASSGD